LVVEKPTHILQVNTVDSLGGAARVAWNLHKAYLNKGIKAKLAVGTRYSDDPNILLIQNDEHRNLWARIWITAGDVFTPLVGKVRGVDLLRDWIHWIGQPRRWLDKQRGYEDFDYPGTWKLLGLPGQRLEILHCHNLHGKYFDLRALPWLSSQIPTILTLHDAWLLSGHCSHSFDCDRWKFGCGKCPDLKIYPAIPRDATAENWQRKQKIFKESRIYISTPSRWLMNKVEQSMLTPSIIEARVINNGVDLTIFQNANKQKVRDSLGIPQDTKVLLFTAEGIQYNIWKDYQTLRAAIIRVAEQLDGQRILFIALGENATGEQLGRAELRFVEYQKDPRIVARYYQAADIYIHAALEDTFPNTIVEALACGTPVIASAVGGIPEQIQNGITGFLVPPKDPEAMAEKIICLLSDSELHERLSQNAINVAKKYFDINRQVDAYLAWYLEIFQNFSNPNNLQTY